MQKTKALMFLIIIAVLVVAASVGYFFAKEKSKPQFESKIDKVMFDRKNKSPSFVLQLPDKHETVKELAQPAPVKNDQTPKAMEADELLEKIPLAAKMPKSTLQSPLEHIDIKPDLLEEKENSVLPKISKDGKKPWTEYGKAETIQPNFYKVFIVIDELGLDATVTKAAIESLPANISLSFSPYAPNLEKQIKAARSMGHETYIDLLLSSKDFLKSDTGPLAMSITSGMDENIKRLKKSLNVKAPVGGLIIRPGLIDTENPERMQKILAEIKNLGLLMIDTTAEDNVEKITTSGLPRKKADIVIDSDFTREEIDRRLQTAEQIAKNNGSVLIAANPKPVVLHAINDWAATFSPQISNYEELKNTVITKPLALMPISNAVVE